MGVGITDVVGFNADNVTDLRTAFEEAVDDDLGTCQKLGKPPQQPASGKLMLRVPPKCTAPRWLQRRPPVPA